MSQGVPSGLEGQIDSPNPFELIWEKYRPLVVGIAIALIAALVIKYGWQYVDRKATDEKWSSFASSLALQKRYVDLPALDQRTEQAAGQYFSNLKLALVGDLPEDLATASAADLDKALADAAGDDTTEPLLLWAIAARAVFSGEYDAAITRLNELKAKYPRHFLCTESDYPVQWRDEQKDPEDEDPETPTKPKRPEDIKFVDPVRGSAVSRLLDDISQEKQFHAANRRLFDPVEPDSDQVAVIKFVDSDPNSDFNGEIKIRFFTKQAPKHVEAFLNAATVEKFFDGIRVHQLVRKGTNNANSDPTMQPSEFKFGLTVTKDEEVRTKWTPSSSKVSEEHTIDWEGSDELSHFAGTLAAEPAPAGKSQVERLVITGADVGARYDGSRVIFGRVVEGLEFVQRVIDAPFASETEEQSGQGPPVANIRIESIVVEG